MKWSVLVLSFVVVGCSAGNQGDAKAAPLVEQDSPEMADAKAVANVAIQVAKGNNDFLPVPGNYRLLITPRLKTADKGAIDHFIWTIPGGELSRIKDPHTTELGRVKSAQGDVVAFADGSVRIEAKKR